MLACVVLLGVWTCVDASGPPSGDVVSLRLLPREPQVALGDSVEFVAFGLTAAGDTVALEVVWSAATGEIKGKGQGKGQYKPRGGGKDKVKATADSLADSTTVSITTPVGALQIMTATLGEALDPDGYAVVLDAVETHLIGINDQITVSDQPAGDYSIALSNVAGNCRVSGQNPRTVSVLAGDTAQTAFSVTCTARSGSVGLRVVNDHFLEFNGRPWHGRGTGNYWTIADLNVDFREMIDVYAAKGTTLMRMTLVGTPVRHSQVDPATEILYPVKRVGPGMDNVGGLKFDCRQLDPAFYDRLEAVVAHAASRGVVIVLVLWDEIPLEAGDSRWNRNPWHPNNNVNDFGLPADLGSDGDPRIERFYDLSNASLLASQEAVAREVLKRVKPYGNVILSISNEYTGGEAWHHHWNEVVQAFEADNGGPSIFTDELVWNGFTPSYTDLISPTTNNQGLPDQAWSSSPARPVVAHKTGAKLEPPNERDAARRAQWQMFMNGGHTSDDSHDGTDPPDQHNSVDSQAGADMIRVLADFVDALTDVNAMMPNHVSSFLPSGASDRVGRASRGVEYAVYLPTGGSVTVDLSDANGTFRYDWVDPRDGRIVGSETVQGGGLRSFSSPFSEAVLHVYPE